MIAQKKTPPNIVLIYADDLGYSDLHCYGKEHGAGFIETPHIDKLASESVKFTNAYSAAPLCSPSRAALLTSKSPARLNFEKKRSLFWHFPYYHPEGKAKAHAKHVIGVEDGYVSMTYPQSAVRKGKYKLLYFYEDQRVELYDLDLREQKDLSRLMPEVAAGLKKELMDYLHGVSARFPREK